MTENESPLIFGDAGNVQASVIGAVRVGSTLPNAYRLVTKDDGNGSIVYVLQGCFTWTQGWSQRGGEWRDLETQDWLHAKDDVPFGPLF